MLDQKAEVYSVTLKTDEEFWARVMPKGKTICMTVYIMINTRLSSKMADPVLQCLQSHLYMCSTSNDCYAEKLSTEEEHWLPGRPMYGVGVVASLEFGSPNAGH